MRRWEIDTSNWPDSAAIADKLERCARGLGLDAGQRLTLKSVPGGHHWHLKLPGVSGVLEATLDVSAKRLWLSAHENRMAPWIEPMAIRLIAAIKN